MLHRLCSRFPRNRGTVRHDDEEELQEVSFDGSMQDPEARLAVRRAGQGCPGEVSLWF